MADDANAEAQNGTTTEEIKTEAVPSEVQSEPTDLEKKIIRQIEYYFGDANLVRDKFLLEEIKKEEGWVKLATLLTFNRLKSLTEDPKVIVEALKKSDEELLEVNPDGTCVRRHPTKPLPTDSEEHKKEIQQRLLYVKGFPTDLSLDDLIEFFDKFGGESIQMRKDAKKKFKGSVFVLFKSVETASAFLGESEIKFKDQPLIERMYKNDYFQKKQNEKLGEKCEAVKNKEEAKKKREQEEKEQLQSRITRGSILKVTGIKDGTKVEVIKELFNKYGKVAWVDFNSGDAHAFVRYATENLAKEAWEKALGEAEGGKVKLEDCELSAEVLEGDEEEKHWKNIFLSMNNRFNKSKGGRGRGKRRGAGDGPGGKRSRH